MEQKEILKKLEEYKSLINDIKNKLDIDNKKNKISELEGISNDSSFWNDMENAKNVLSELKGLRDICKKYDTVNESINDVNDIVNTGINEEDAELIETEMESINESLSKLKLFALLSGEFDSSNAYVEIHSGAGGTESNDWANMLLRMYLRYFEKNGEIRSISKFIISSAQKTQKFSEKL